MITEYQSLQTLGLSGMPYTGGVVEWYYVPIEFIASFPAINPVTQRLLSQPILLPGKQWYGPVNMPNTLILFIESTAATKAGIYYKLKATASLPGSSMDVHVNLENIVYHQLCMIVRYRSGDFWLVFGNDKCGVDCDFENSTGEGQKGIHVNKLTFTYESPNRALVLSEFNREGSVPPVIGDTTLIVLAIPSNLSYTEVTASSISLTWFYSAAQQTKIESFLIYRSTSLNGTYILLSTLSASNRAFLDIGVVRGTSYYYKIRVKAVFGYSDFSDVYSVTRNLDLPNSNSPLPLGWRIANSVGEVIIQMDKPIKDVSGNQGAFNLWYFDDETGQVFSEILSTYLDDGNDKIIHLVLSSPIKNTDSPWLEYYYVSGRMKSVIDSHLVQSFFLFSENIIN